MAIITLYEHGKLYVGAFDATRPSVTAEQAKVLCELKRTLGFNVFQYVDRDTLATRQYVGAIQVGPHTIEVLPKIERIDGRGVRRNLVGMLSVALDLDISPGDAARIAVQEHGILEALIRIYCEKLFKQVHKGLDHRYEALEENLYVLRGKLNIARQIHRNGARPEQLWCSYDEFVVDTPLNQILKAATRFLLTRTSDLRNQRLIQELLRIFEDVSDIPRQSLSWHRVEFDRLNGRYSGSFELARMFLLNVPPDVVAGSASGFSLFFDMNNLFEKYIGRLARRIIGNTGISIHLQGPQRYLAFNETSQCHAFAMRPDIVAQQVGKVTWILDTKWKELTPGEAREGVVHSDFYQMYAYASRYGCDDVILLYPHHSNLGSTPGVRTTYTASFGGGNRTAHTDKACIRVATVDLSNLADVSRQIRNIVSGHSASAGDMSGFAMLAVQ